MITKWATARNRGAIHINLIVDSCLHMFTTLIELSCNNYFGVVLIDKSSQIGRCRCTWRLLIFLIPSSIISITLWEVSVDYDLIIIADIKIMSNIYSFIVCFIIDPVEIILSFYVDCLRVDLTLLLLLRLEIGDCGGVLSCGEEEMTLRSRWEERDLMWSFLT